MYDNLIAIVLQLIIAGISFCVGKFLLPRLPKDTAAVIQDKLDLVKTYSDQYVNWADRFMEGAGGTEKLNAVVGILKEVASRYGLQATDQDLTAIAQTSFENMSLKWDELEGNISAKAQEMAATMCMTSGNIAAFNQAVHTSSGAVDQQTIDEANEALTAALSALQDAKRTITNLKALAESNGQPTTPLVKHAIETPKQVMQNKIIQLKEATATLFDDVEPEEVEYETEPDYDGKPEESESTPSMNQTMMSKVSPINVEEGMRLARTPTPTTLKELAATQAVRTIAGMSRSSATDDLAQYLK